MKVIKSFKDFKVNEEIDLNIEPEIIKSSGKGDPELMEIADKCARKAGKDANAWLSCVLDGEKGITEKRKNKFSKKDKVECCDKCNEEKCSCGSKTKKHKKVNEGFERAPRTKEEGRRMAKAWLRDEMKKHGMI